LTSDNMIFVMAPGTNSFLPVGRIPKNQGNLIGIDFRVSNNALYGLTDTGNSCCSTFRGRSSLRSTPPPSAPYHPVLREDFSRCWISTRSSMPSGLSEATIRTSPSSAPTAGSSTTPWSRPQ
jgi:hypothetical protein